MVKVWFNGSSAIITAALMMTITDPVHAQDETKPLTGWTFEERADGGLGFRHQQSDGTAIATVIPTSSLTDGSATQIGSLEKDCPGIQAAPAEETNQQYVTLGMTNRSTGAVCRITIVNGGEVVAVTRIVSKRSSGTSLFKQASVIMGQVALVKYKATGVSGGSEMPAPVEVVGANSGPSPIASAKTMQAAVASIPANNRPIAMINVSEWDSIAMSVMPTPYILFANGYAVDECDPWDFSQMAPTPDGLRSIGSKCTVKRWQKVGSGYRLQDDDGDWSDVAPAGYIRGFKAGERINVNHSNRGGTGGYGTSSTWGAGLQMTSDGQFASSQWSGHAISTAGATGYGGGRGSTNGTYYLDGFIIAVQDGSGQITLGTIGRKVESGGTYIYLNGDMMWD